MAMKYSGETKITENLTFTLNYADGEKAEVEKGVLFSIDDDEKMDIHIGAGKAYEIFGVYFCFMEFLTRSGLINLFDGYVEQMMRDVYQKEGGNSEAKE